MFGWYFSVGLHGIHWSLIQFLGNLFEAIRNFPAFLIESSDLIQRFLSESNFHCFSYGPFWQFKKVVFRHFLNLFLIQIFLLGYFPLHWAVFPAFKGIFEFSFLSAFCSFVICVSSHIRIPFTVLTLFLSGSFHRWDYSWANTFRTFQSLFLRSNFYCWLTVVQNFMIQRQNWVNWPFHTLPWSFE